MRDRERVEHAEGIQVQVIAALFLYSIERQDLSANAVVVHTQGVGQRPGLPQSVTVRKAGNVLRRITEKETFRGTLGAQHFPQCLTQFCIHFYNGDGVTSSKPTKTSRTPTN